MPSRTRTPHSRAGPPRKTHPANHPAAREGVSRVEVPRGDVEVDIDLESVEDGVYLWGTLVTIRSPGWAGCPAGYRAFCRWTPMTADVETGLFTEFWTWLAGLRRAAAGAGRTFRAYCYNAAAEGSQLRRLAAATGRSGEVAAFTGSASSCPPIGSLGP